MKILLLTVMLAAANVVSVLAAGPGDPPPYPTSDAEWARLSDLRSVSGRLRQIRRRDRLIIGTGFEFRALNARTGEGPDCEGFIADYGHALAARVLGDPNKIEWRDVRDGPIAHVLRGDVDIVLDAIPRGGPEDPTRAVEFVGEFLRGGSGLLIRKSGTIRSIGDIRNTTRIVYPRGARKDVNWLRATSPRAHFIEYSTPAAAFAALKAGGGDVLTADVPVLYDLASQDPAFAPTSRYVDRPYYGIIAKGDPLWKRYLVEFNDDLRASGGYEALFRKWFIPLGGEMLR